MRIIGNRLSEECCCTDHFKRIYPLTHRSNVPLQVFSGETTPFLVIDLRLSLRGYLDIPQDFWESFTHEK